MKALRGKGTHIWIVRIFEARSEPLRTRPETTNLSYQFHLGISPRYFLCKMLDSSYLSPGRNLNLSSGAPESAKLRRLRYLALSLPLASLHSPCQRHYEIKSRQSHSTSPHIKFSPSWHHLHKPSSLHSDLPHPSHSKNTPSTPFPHTNNHLPTPTPTPTPTHHSPLTTHHSPLTTHQPCLPPTTSPAARAAATTSPPRPPPASPPKEPEVKAARAFLKISPRATA